MLQYIEVNGELDQSYNHTVDIWSLSVILFLVLTGESLFQAPSRLIRYITGGFPFPADQLLANHVSDNGCDFLRKTMQPRPESRPRADECRQHLWVQRDLQATKSSRYAVLQLEFGTPLCYIFFCINVVVLIPL